MNRSYIKVAVLGALLLQSSNVLAMSFRDTFVRNCTERNFIEQHRVEYFKSFNRSVSSTITFESQGERFEFDIIGRTSDRVAKFHSELDAEDLRLEISDDRQILSIFVDPYDIPILTLECPPNPSGVKATRRVTHRAHRTVKAKESKEKPKEKKKKKRNERRCPNGMHLGPNGRCYRIPPPGGF